MFQLPERIEQPLEAFLRAPVTGGAIKRSLPRPLVRLYRRVKFPFVAGPAPRMAMCGLACDEVLTRITRAGGRVLSTRPDASHGIPGVVGVEYWVTREPA